MKKMIRMNLGIKKSALSVKYLAAAFLPLILFFKSLDTAAEQVITLAVDPFPPYYQGEIGSDVMWGMGVDLLDELFSRVEGVSYTIKVMSWLRVLREVEEGKVDGTPLIRRTSERERYLDYTKPVLRTLNAIWYMQGDFPGGFSWNSIKDLEQYRIGLTRGHTYGDEVDQAIEEGKLNVVFAQTLDQQFHMLIRGRVEIVIANDAIGRYLADLSLTEVRQAQKPVDMDIYHIAFSRKSNLRHLLPKIDEAISSMERDGTIDRLINDVYVAPDQSIIQATD